MLLNKHIPASFIFNKVKYDTIYILIVFLVVYFVTEKYQQLLPDMALTIPQGKAERIKTTVFPVSYRIFLHSIIYLFVVTLSIALNDVAGIFEIPLLLVISLAFFLLEKSATHMQDPFENRPTDTAVTAIARNIEINIKQLIKEPEIPEPLKPESFYLS